MICGFLEMVNTVEPCEEKVWATVLSRPLIMVTTAITAVTPTTIPIKVRDVRSLLALKLAVATRKASQIGGRRKAELEVIRVGRIARENLWRRGPAAWSPPRCIFIVSYLIRWSFSISPSRIEITRCAR